MNKRKIFFFILVSVVASSCTKYADITYVTAAIGLHNADNSGQSPVDAGNSVAARAYAIRLHITNAVSGFSGPGSEDLSKGHYLKTDPLLSFTVSALQRFDSTHPAGTSLNEYFLAGSGTSVYTLASSSSSLFSFPGKGKTSWQYDQYVVLMQPPDSAGTYQFVVDAVFYPAHRLRDTLTVDLY